MSTRTGITLRRCRALIATSAIAAATTLVPAAAADAATPAGSIVYVKAHNVWITNADKSVVRRVTSDGGTATTDGTGGVGYAAPSESDAGLVVAIRNQHVAANGGYTIGYLWVMRHNGTLVRKFAPLQFSQVGSEPCPAPVTINPNGLYSAQVSPDGTHIVYTALAYYQDSSCNVSTTYQTYVVGIQGTNAAMIARPGGDGSYLENGSWSGNSRVLVTSVIFGSVTLYYADLTDHVAQTWRVEGDFVDEADELPFLRQGVLSTTGLSSSTGTQVMRLWSSTGFTHPPRARCEYPQVSRASNWFVGFSTISPDATMVVWQEASGPANQANEGLYLLPIGDITTTCPRKAARTLFVQGGLNPFWSPAAA